jgi:hypothetical protein
MPFYSQQIKAFQFSFWPVNNYHTNFHSIISHLFLTKTGLKLCPNIYKIPLLVISLKDKINSTFISKILIPVIQRGNSTVV